VIETVGGVESLFHRDRHAGRGRRIARGITRDAVSVWLPLVVVVESQISVYGDAVSSAPRLAPVDLELHANHRDVICGRRGTVMLDPDTFAPPAGAVIDTVGGVGSLLTVTATPVDVLEFPAASRATAVSVWLPLVADVESQVSVYGVAVSSAPRLTPSSLNCTPTTRCCRRPSRKP